MITIHKQTSDVQCPFNICRPKSNDQMATGSMLCNFIIIYVHASVVLVTTANDGDAMVVAVVGNGVVVVGGIFVVIAVDTGSAVIRESPVGFVATVAPTASRSASWYVHNLEI